MKLTLIIYVFLYTINHNYQSLVKINGRSWEYVQVGGKR